jgi:transposase
VGRLVKKLLEGGEKALILKEKPGRPGVLRQKKAEIMEIVARHYHDFGPTLAGEKLEERHGIKVSRETLRKWMMEAGLWTAKKAKKARIHQSRERRPQFGELVQIDGSFHDWFEGRAPKCCLIVFIDDATSKIIHMRFEKAETIYGYMRAVKAHIEAFGRPVAYYSDRHAIFLTTRDQDNLYQDTQFKTALNELGIGLICAKSPQAKGRVERSNQTLQDRLVKELRLENISSMEAANVFLDTFTQKYNDRFAVPPACPEDAHRPLLQSSEALSLILSTSDVRKVTKNLEVRWHNRILQLQNIKERRRIQQGKVKVCELYTGEIKILYNGKLLDYKVLSTKTPPSIADDKEVNGVVETLLAQQDSQQAA